jgi:hypothetical protein
MGALGKKNKLHACGRFDTTAGAIQNAGSGNWSVANVAVGIADITLQDPIDTLERQVFVTSRTQSVMIAVIPASDTDTNIRVHAEDDSGADADTLLDFLVLRSAG